MTTAILDEEQRLFKNFQTWIDNAFGDLFIFFNQRLQIEQVYADSMTKLLNKMANRAPCALPSLNQAWSESLSHLKTELSIRQDATSRAKETLKNLISEEESRKTTSSYLFSALTTKSSAYQRCELDATAAFTRLSRPQSPLHSKSDATTGVSRRPSVFKSMMHMSGSSSKPKKETSPPIPAEDLEKDMDRYDQQLRIALYRLNLYRLNMTPRLKALVFDEQDIGEGFKNLFGHLNAMNSNLKNISASYTPAHMDIGADLSHRLERLSSQLPTSPQHPLPYVNPRFQEECRYTIFGLPLREEQQVVNGVNWNPRVLNVADVLLLNASGWGVTSVSPTDEKQPNMGRRGSAPNAFAPTNRPLSPIGEGHVLGYGRAATGGWTLIQSPINVLIREKAHEIERDWELDMSRNLRMLSDRQLNGANISIGLLAHFFNMLPTPFIPLPSDLYYELENKFTPSTRWDRGNVSSLAKVWDLMELRSKEEKNLLQKLCERLEIAPEEAGSTWGRILTRQENMEVMVSELVHSWRTFLPKPRPTSIPPAPSTSAPSTSSSSIPKRPSYQTYTPTSPTAIGDIDDHSPPSYEYATSPIATSPPHSALSSSGASSKSSTPVDGHPSKFFIANQNPS